MSDEEIKKFNDQWMVEMTTDDITNTERVKSKDFDIIWNAAIEACALLIDNAGKIDGKTLRELKK